MADHSAILPSHCRCGGGEWEQGIIHIRFKPKRTLLAQLASPFGRHVSARACTTCGLIELFDTVKVADVKTENEI